MKGTSKAFFRVAEPLIAIHAIGLKEMRLVANSVGQKAPMLGAQAVSSYYLIIPPTRLSQQESPWRIRASVATSFSLVRYRFCMRRLPHDSKSVLVLMC